MVEAVRGLFALYVRRNAGVNQNGATSVYSAQ